MVKYPFAFGGGARRQSVGNNAIIFRYDMLAADRHRCRADERPRDRSIDGMMQDDKSAMS